MTADPGPLLVIAAELERHAALLRARAGIIGSAPASTQWSSVGARAWADGVARIRLLLLHSADEAERTAARFRARAAEVCAWD
jgi:hypothetical protein